MNQIELVRKIQKLCDMRLYDVAFQLTNHIQIKEFSIRAHFICMHHERRAELDNKMFDCRNKFMPKMDFTLCLDEIKDQWLKQNKTLPGEVYVIEFFGTGESYLSGTVDDRLLCVSGNICERTYPRQEAAVFSCIEDAARAANKISNRRDNSILGVVPYYE